MLPRTLLPISALLTLALAAEARAQTPVFQPRPCPDPVEGARCGVVAVPENRDVPGGRMLELNVLVLPARSGAPARRAVTGFGGGPGQAATQMAGWVAEKLAPLREDRDLLFIDQRGTGRSAPLQCALRSPDDPQTYLGDYLPPGPVARCLEELGRSADLTRYGYLELAHDVEAVRRALGYEQLDLWGASYGTRAALVYMRAYPGSVRAAVLEGVVPMGFTQPETYARSTDAALAGLEADCRADAACAAAFPGWMRELREVARRLEQAPGAAEIVDPETGARLRLTIDRATFADLVRRMLYDAASAAQIPYVVHRAHQGDLRPAARLALQDRRGYARGLWWGLSLAITCTEDIPFIDLQEAARDNGRTFLGDWRVAQQAAACRGWPRYALPADYHQPFDSRIPTLLVSGALDPVTPPSGGEEAMRSVRNSLHVVVPHAGHSYQGMQGAACVDSLIVRFYQQASVAGLDTSCVQGIRRPPFVTHVPEPIEMERAALERFAGTFAGEGPPPLEVRFEALDGVLRATFPADDFTVIASPVSPTTFRWEAFPPAFRFEFAADGRTVTLSAPGQTLTLTRRP